MTNIATYINPSREEWPALCRRCQRDDAAIETTVRGILEQVRDGGDAALREIVGRIDGYVPESFELTEAQRQALAEQVAQPVQRAIRQAKANIEAMHRAEMPQEVRVETAPGVVCMQRAVPIQKVGIYIPGGKAPLFSTVLMLAAPAKIAGVPEVVLCTPADRQGRIAPEIIYAANLCGVDRIYAIGGAQAIAAMAYGTETVPKVDKIFGPGNRYVTKAKQMVSADTCAIDMPAGPSEVMVVADSTADADCVAADFLSQAEHGDDSQAMLVCDSIEIAEAVKEAVMRQMAQLRRNATIERALDNSRIIVMEGDDARERIMAFANCYAPEHLIISMREPWQAAAQVTAAGSVFIGNYSPESAGDYASGTNHTLPTSGWARAYSGVNIDSYMRKITYQELTPEGLKGIAETIETMALAEGLDAHANAVRLRVAKQGNFGFGGQQGNFGFGSQKGISGLVRENIARLEPYSTARDDYQGPKVDVYLDANESPYDNGTNRYPDPHQRALKARISQIKGVDAAKIFVGNGSDEAIDLLFRIFCKPGVDSAAAIAPSYGMYGVCAAINDVSMQQVLLNEDFSLPQSLYEGSANGAKLLFVCSPNNPSGNAYEIAELERLAEAFDGILVVDEAYVDYSTKGSMLSVLDKHPNLVVLQTMSKARGMAALRVGMAFASEEIIALMSNVKYPYNIGAETQKAVLKALDTDISGQVAEVLSQRQLVEDALRRSPRVREVYPSDANFVLAKVDDADRMYDELITTGVIVRNRTHMPLCADCLRITIGTPEENQKMLRIFLI